MIETNRANPPAIELIGIEKRFGPVVANKKINLSIPKGTIHGIIGENGAGKSTLMSILYGFYTPDAGQIRINGQPLNIRSSQTAIKHGIGMVHQHFMLVENLSVLESIVLGAEGGTFLKKGLAACRAALRRIGRDYEISVDPDAFIEELPVGLQQRVEILKALYRGADILILDEPTGVLTPQEATHLFRVVKQLKAQGKTVILITHKLDEIMAITDAVSVMRRGEIVDTVKTAESSRQHLAEMMVGRSISLGLDKTPAQPGAAILSVDHLTIRDRRDVVAVNDVSFDVHAGEIVGIAGVAGNGQSELLEALAGLRKPLRGDIRINGTRIDGHSPSKLRALGLAHVPEDRHEMGLVMSFTASESSVLGYEGSTEFQAGGFLSPTKIRAHAVERMRQYDIRPANPELKTANFSGGNQQKLILAREFERDPDVLVIGQPTRGVDVGAIAFIHRKLVEMRDRGKATIFVSVELDEIEALSDRVLVMCQGRIVGECPPGTDRHTIGLMMAGMGNAQSEFGRTIGHARAEGLA